MAAARPEKTTFVSLRWRFMLPLFLALLIAAMIGAYWVGRSLSSGMEVPQVNLLLNNSRAIAARMTELYEQSRLEAQRVAFTRGVAEEIQDGAAQDLQTILEPLARLANLDNLIVTNDLGTEVVGLLRVEKPDGSIDYAVSSGLDLQNEPVIRSVLDEGYVGATGLVRTQAGLMVYTAVPVNQGDRLVGSAILGQSLPNVLDNLKADGMADIAFYGAENTLLQTTLPTDSDLDSLRLESDLFQQTLGTSGQVPVRNIQVNGQLHQAAYLPFQFGPQVLGVLGTLVTDNIPFLAGLGQQMISLTLASVTAALIVGLFLTVNSLMLGRLKRVHNVATALAAGEAMVRTGMKANDEIGAVGRALDQYANYVEQHQDALRSSLRRQRRESEYLLAVLDSIPDGVLVQDLDGRVTIMNERAKELLGSYEITGDTSLNHLTALATDKLGAALAPGLYALGDPQRLELNRRMLSAQAAAVVNLSRQRMGSVVVLRDITQEVRRERAQEIILSRMEGELQRPLVKTPSAQPIANVAHELSRHSAALQKLIAEMREITLPDAPGVREGYRPLRLETLIWAIANEWRQVASAANLSVTVLIERRGLFVLGDERRLRWAIGNLVDNAIKYTPPGGKLTLEIRGEAEGKANLRIRDNGTGILPEELPQVFTRFFRGTPTTQDGQMIRAPGMGQGLSIARQVIEGHGGMVQIKSKVGVGTAVYFTLPLTAAVSLQLPQFAFDLDMEGETMRLQEDEL